MHRSALLLLATLVAGCQSAALRQPQASPASSPLPAAIGRPGQGPDAASIRGEVEAQVVGRFGQEALDQAKAAQSSVMVAAFRGRFASQGPTVNVAVRTSAGWTGRKNGSQAPLSGDVVRELDALLKNPALWREAPFWPEMDCPDAGALLMVVRHQGRERVTRQACGTNGLTGRLLETVAAEAIPTGTSRY